MKKGYLLAAVVFAVVFCLVLVGCPKKQGPGAGMNGMGPGMGGKMMPGQQNAASSTSSPANTEYSASDIV